MRCYAARDILTQALPVLCGALKCWPQLENSAIMGIISHPAEPTS
jgi:hypothetical protein